MSTVAGIDFSTRHIDIVLIPEDPDERGATHHAFPLEGADAFDRTRNIRQAMPLRSWWDEQGVTAIGIEEPMGPGHITAKLKAVQGGILQTLPAALLVHPLSPSEWRKGAGLKGNATKDEVQAFVREQLGENPHWPQDAFDAWAIAVAVRALVVVG